jgi:hypothetical protein
LVWAKERVARDEQHSQGENKRLKSSHKAACIVCQGKIVLPQAHFSILLFSLLIVFQVYLFASILRDAAGRKNF